MSYFQKIYNLHLFLCGGRWKESPFSTKSVLPFIITDLTKCKGRAHIYTSILNAIALANNILKPLQSNINACRLKT